VKSFALYRCKRCGTFHYVEIESKSENLEEAMFNSASLTTVHNCDSVGSLGISELVGISKELPKTMELY